MANSTECERIANYAAAGMPTHSSRVELFRFAAFDVGCRGAPRPRLDQPTRASCGICRLRRWTRLGFYRPVGSVSTVSERAPVAPVRRLVTVEPVLTGVRPHPASPECFEAGGENREAGSDTKIATSVRSVKTLPGGLSEDFVPREARSDAGRQPAINFDGRSFIFGRHPLHNERSQQEPPARTIGIRNQLQRRPAVRTEVR